MGAQLLAKEKEYVKMNILKQMQCYYIKDSFLSDFSFLRM